MIKNLTPPYTSPQDIERLARAFAATDGIMPDAYLPRIMSMDIYSFGQCQNVPAWQSYIPKVLEFLQMKMVYDNIYPHAVAPSQPFMGYNMPVGEVKPLPDMEEQEIETFKTLCLEQAGSHVGADISADDVRQLAKNHEIKKYMLRRCSMCGSGLFYSIDGDYVTYNSACGCTSYSSPPSQESFRDLARNFNMQDTPAVRQRMLVEFISSGEKQTEMPTV